MIHLDVSSFNDNSYAYAVGLSLNWLLSAAVRSDHCFEEIRPVLLLSDCILC